jgi:hypothetical protein
MHEDYENDNYYDDDSQDNLESQHKHYFKFDPEAWDAWGKWLYDALNEAVEISPNVWYAYGFPSKSIPVNSYISNTEKGNTFQYLGSNYAGQAVWKNKYFIVDSINISYRKHLEANAKHFLQQPIYYRGLFDILN